MGLDSSIRKRSVDTIEVKYWRKNWVLQNWMNTQNCEYKVLSVDMMRDLLEETKEMEKEEYPGSEGWTPDDWDRFRDEIREVIQDMEEDISNEYTYDGWW